MTDSVTLDDIERAAQELRGVIRETPMLPARWLSEAIGGPAYLKCENLQRAGSFKIRGAYIRMSRLSSDERARGVVAASMGNHAQGVALAASMLGIHSTVYMPIGAPLPKLIATREYGATVEQVGHSMAEALPAAQEFADRTGAVLIHPFDHVDIVAGQGTIGLEILDEVPDVRTVAVCTGGGGLLAGIAVAIKARAPHVRVVGVQAAGAAAYPLSLEAGCPTALTTPLNTMADGIAITCPGEVPFALIRDHVDEVVTVDEEALAQAELLLLERGKLLVEPAGSVGVAAFLDHPDRFETPAVAILSGGNVDPLLLMRVIRHGLAAAGRFAWLAIRIGDMPGSLAKLLAELANADANVIEVEHSRIDPHLSVDEVDIHVQLETQGRDHLLLVQQHLRDSGYHVELVS